MGILNVTPDSFSDGGRYVTVNAALDKARRMKKEGADIIDVGGESTRPGAPPVSAEEEMDRVLPVIEALAAEFELPLSIDTTKSSVAAKAISAGVEFVNDISGLTFDPEMAEVVASGHAGLFLMHTRGRPQQMQSNTVYRDVVEEVIASLRESLATAEQSGIPREKLAVDPGIGFGKDVAGNLELIRRLDALQILRRPILLGTSRKSFIGKVLGHDEPLKRLSGTLATIALGVRAGARIFRVHDIAPAREAALMAWAIDQGQSWTTTRFKP